ncbi:DNA packaging protein [Chachezhania sediminis]|uniref:DNA packaging protein n=1 Tax=Chachezhania sediminis TaxID=2599291 RepID=UPI00131AC06A|nr:DNA packaging protein [Chachezhania sediminis]
MRILEELPLGDSGASVMRIGGADLCDLLGISPALLSDLKRRQIAIHIGHDAYDLGATVKAYVAHLRETASGRGGEQHVNTLTAERARLAKEQADAQALKNARLRGDLVEAAEVERTWSDTLRHVRSRMLAVPSRLRADFPQADAAIFTAMDRAQRDALTELGNDDA